MNLIRAVVCVFPPFVLAACGVTHETSVLVGTPRTPTTSEQVRLYTSPPKKYTDIALICSDAAYDYMDTQAWLETAVFNAKTEAAKIGANGILLNRLGGFRFGGSSFFLLQPSLARDELVSGKAIYVVEE
ncbi:hypothetical protein QTI17_31455 [Variovorax sp. J31P179]|uniref:hypothetical protein n=1 Tax=Variovorax sp. J31P179 TaxID=3053508 RepID=UPI0025779FF1|nr:hypothetical protein [Variovorax sp. J31P179]MDM0085112.1 hypothetical protein [Variovorax sp. J31P179]